VTSSQLAAVFDGSSSATAEIVVVSLAEARDKLNAAMTILTSAAQDLHIYMAQVLGSPPGDTAAPSSVVIRDENLGLTEPSRPPDSKAVPEGEPETAPRRPATSKSPWSSRTGRPLALARAGYRVRRLPNIGHGVNPDFEVEGRIFDCYSPNRGTTVDSVVTRVRKKSRLQASRFVINLDRGGLDAGEVRARLLSSRPSRVGEVLVVRNDTVSRVWP
jgi:hypothetical protein